VAESAFIVCVPEAEASVGAMRDRCDPTAALGVPAHITILMPFLSPERITTQTLSEAKSALRAVRAFPFTLNKVARWPETTYLVPEPAAPFVQLTRAIGKAFPEFPPYGGRHPNVVPHLTVADGSASRAEEAASELRAILSRRGPIASICKTVDLFENSSGTWRFMHAITLDRSDG
jgi:2'-5' RNA ligase